MSRVERTEENWLDRFTGREKDIQMEENGEGWEAVEDLHRVLVRRERRGFVFALFLTFFFMLPTGIMIGLMAGIMEEDLSLFWKVLLLWVLGFGLIFGGTIYVFFWQGSESYHPVRRGGRSLLRLIPFSSRQLLRQAYKRELVSFAKQLPLLAFVCWLIIKVFPELSFAWFLTPLLYLILSAGFSIMRSRRLFTGFGYKEVKQ